MSLIYLAKANNDLVSHCECETALITFPPQMDCPWCGCGWLFTCIDCRKAFTFAKAVQLDESWHEFALRDLTNRWGEAPGDDEVEQWVSAMQEMLADVEVGDQYVCLDGAFIPTDSAGVEFEGWHAAHDFEYVPQVAALKDSSIIETVLANENYWQSNAIPDEPDD